VQSPLEFNVVVTFRPGSDPEVLQSGPPIAVASARDYAGPALIPDALANRPTTDAFLRDQLTDARNRLRELERASRLALERSPSNEAMATLHLELARLNDNMARVEERLRRDLANQNVSELEQLKRQAEMAAQRLLYFERQLEVARGLAEPTTTAAVSPTPTPPFDGSPQLRSPSGRAPLQVGGAVSAPRVIKSPKPLYTAETMRARIQGSVAIEALIDEQGRVADARVIRSIPQLDEAALAAAKQWEFTPGLRNGEPVPVLVRIELEFNLRK
jgi:protein TonB